VRELLDYLTQLELHNERSWYHAHKAEKKAADETFAALVQELIFRMSEWEPALLERRPGELIFRIPRDVRMWPDRPPYNPAYRAQLSPHGKRAVPVGCFLWLQPGDRSFAAAGLHTPSLRQATLMVRESIYRRQEEWEELVESAGCDILGEQLKNVPREYPADAPCGEWLKNKSWYASVPLTDEQVLSDGLGETLNGIFRNLKPLNDFLNEALAGFRFPDEL
jgi:uncharacterized protein (TIGR02453 family)